ncbi:MAG: Cthe_2314 family HEPN domain-containing protein [bacterium]
MFLNDYEQALKDIAIKEKIISLIDFDLMKFDDQNALSFLSLITKTRQSIKNEGKNFDLMTQDLIYSISSDIKFALANIFLYFPLSNNFINEIATYPNGTQLPTYFRKIEDKRFFFYVNCAFEKLYNFWDRIGDILSEAFQLNLSERNIYFSSVIDELSKNTHNSEHWQWLREFYTKEYLAILNHLRKKIVHYRQKDTYFFDEWLKKVINYQTDPEGIKILQQEKDELPGLLKRHLELANTGFEKMVKFIKECGPYEKII